MGGTVVGGTGAGSGRSGTGRAGVVVGGTVGGRLITVLGVTAATTGAGSGTSLGSSGAPSVSGSESSAADSADADAAPSTATGPVSAATAAPTTTGAPDSTATVVDTTSAADGATGAASATTGASDTNVPRPVAAIPTTALTPVASVALVADADTLAAAVNADDAADEMAPENDADDVAEAALDAADAAADETDEPVDATVLVAVVAVVVVVAVVAVVVVVAEADVPVPVPVAPDAFVGAADTGRAATNQAVAHDSGPITRRRLLVDRLKKARTTSGSKWVPAHRASSARASWAERGCWYERTEVITSNTSATATMRAGIEMAYPLMPFGYPVPSHFSWCWATASTLSPSQSASGAASSAPRAGWVLMTANSSSVNRPGLFRISPSMRNLPMSWMRPAQRRRSRSSPERPISSPIIWA